MWAPKHYIQLHDAAYLFEMCIEGSFTHGFSNKQTQYTPNEILDVT